MAKQLKDEVPELEPVEIEPEPYIPEPPGPDMPPADPEQAAPLEITIERAPESGRKAKLALLDADGVVTELAELAKPPDGASFVRLRGNEAVQPGDRWDPVSGWVVPEGDTRDLRPLPMRLRSVMVAADPAAVAAILPDYITLTAALRSGMRTPARAWLAGITGGTKAVSTLRAALLAELDR